ncbi:MAG: hypothetical protein WBE06_05755, partial [Phycisphaerae bacterium]
GFSLCGPPEMGVPGIGRQARLERHYISRRSATHRETGPAGGGRLPAARAAPPSSGERQEIVAERRRSG